MDSSYQHSIHRASFTSRVSRMFEHRRVVASDVESTRATTTFEVPLFLSPTRYQPPYAHGVNHDDAEDTRSRSSTQSLIETSASIPDQVRPLTFPSSSQYSSPRLSAPPSPEPSVLAFPEASLISQAPRSAINATTATTTSASTSTRNSSKNMHRRRRRRRRNVAREKIRALTRLSMAFGFTLLITLITYLALAVTGTATGIMFHVLLVLFILCLTGVFAHSALRLFILTKAASRQSERNHSDRWHGHSRNHDRTFFGEIQPDLEAQHDELPPEKPIRVILAEDEEADLDERSRVETVKQPPPVYGNLRSSKRINPNLVQWHKVPPSPLTPTYDEAMSDVHRVVGYRPPSYVESESGATHIVEQGRCDVDKALNSIHPLERERMAGFAMI